MNIKYFITNDDKTVYLLKSPFNYTDEVLTIALAKHLGILDVSKILKADVYDLKYEMYLLENSLLKVVNVLGYDKLSNVLKMETLDKYESDKICSDKLINVLNEITSKKNTLYEEEPYFEKKSVEEVFKMYKELKNIN